MAPIYRSFYYCVWPEPGIWELRFRDWHPYNSSTWRGP